MGTKKQNIVRKMSAFCEGRGLLVTEIADQEVGDDAVKLLKDAQIYPRPVSVKLEDLEKDNTFSLSLTVDDNKDGVFTVLDNSSKVMGYISRLPGRGSDLAGKHFLFTKISDLKHFKCLTQEFTKVKMESSYVK